MSINFNDNRWLIVSIVLHISPLLLFLAIPKNPIILQEQLLQMELVTMSAIYIEAQNESDVAEEKSIFKPDLEKDKDGVYKKQNKSSSASKVKPSVQKQTSGEQSLDATKENSAQTDPVFNAAYLNNPAPIYPDKARMSRIEGKIILDVLVQIDGSAKSVNVKKSSGSSLLDIAAVNAVRQWKFIPAKRGNEFVEAKVLVPVEFKMK